jgi:hypothetical protein
MKKKRIAEIRRFRGNLIEPAIPKPLEEEEIDDEEI